MIRRFFRAGAGASCARPNADSAENRWPPLGEVITVDGLAVHVWDRGTGTPVIVLHGASGNLRDLNFDLAPRLAEHHRVVAFDRPGFGYSDRLPGRGWEPARQAAHLRRATERMGLGPAIVVGHSWGAAAAMAWALDAPEQTLGVVSLAGATMPWGTGVSVFYALLASEIAGPLVRRAVCAGLSEARLGRLIAGIFAPQPVPEGYGAYLGGPLAARPTTLRANAQDLLNLDALLADQARRYADLPIPVEILHGTADTIVGSAIHAEGLHRRLPQSRLTLLDGIGHMPHHARPDAVLDAVARLA